MSYDGVHYLHTNILIRIDSSKFFWYNETLIDLGYWSDFIEWKTVPFIVFFFEKSLVCFWYSFSRTNFDKYFFLPIRKSFFSILFCRLKGLASIMIKKYRPIKSLSWAIFPMQKYITPPPSPLEKWQYGVNVDV